MKKKWLLMMLALAMSASIAACDFGDGESSTPDSQGSSISVQDSTADSTPEDSTPEDSTPEDSTPEDSTPEDSTPDDGGDGPTVETFCIKFVDQEGNVLSEQWLEEGAMPEIPTNVTVPEDTDYVTYTGAWDKEIVAVSDAAVTYTWVITSTKVTVQVTFDGENATDVAKGETVTAPSLKQLGKVVTGWTLNGEPVDLATYEVTEPVNFVSVWTAVPYATSGEAGINAVEWEEGAKWYYEIGTQTEVCDWDVNLPIMAYEEGKTVTYNYNGGPWIFVGINGKYVQGEGVGSEGTISITNVDGVLIVTIENTANPNTVVVKSSVNDADVVAGNKPLTLSVNNGAQYNQFFISKMPTVADSEIVTNLFDGTSGYAADGTAFAPSATSDTGASYTVKETYGNGKISLPKVDYTKYTTVTMDFATSGWTQFGWNEHLFIYNNATAVEGTITITYRDGKVYMVFESEGVTHPQGWDLSFSSTDIHTGNEALTLGYSCLAGTQSITISNFTMTEAPAVAPEEPVEPEEPEVPANLFDGTSGYAADGTAFAPSATSDTGASYTVKETYGNGKISLPKVDYTKYTTVTMDFATSGWTQFGWNEHLFIYNNATAVEGTITITYRDGKVYMVFESEGVTHPQGWDLSFSSTDIHTGNEALTLGYSCLAGTQSITISNFTMTEAPEVVSYAVKFVDSNGNVLSEQMVEEGKIPEIPTNTTTPENTETMIYTGAWDKEIVAAAGDVTYTWVVTSTEVKPANIFDSTSGYTSTGDMFAPSNTSETGASYTVKEEYGMGTISLPKVDFTKYTTVTMDFATSGWIQFGWGSNLFFYNSGSAVKGTITLTYRDNLVYMVFESEGVTQPQGWELYFSSTDIHTGNEALTLGYSCLAGTQSITISNFTMTEAPAVAPEEPVEPEEPEVPANLFDGTSGYAADGTAFAPSATSDTGASYTVKETYGNGKISLPKVDYTKYTTVTMDFATSGWTQFGWNEHLFIYNNATAVEGTITITYRDGKVYMVFESEGVAYPQGWDLSFSSTDIHTGNEALTLGYSCLAGTQSITISNFTMVETPETPEAPYTFEGTGVLDGSSNLLAAASITETGAVYNAPQDKDLYISLPKIDYTKVSKVTFDWQDSGWTKLGSGTAYYSENKADPSISGSVEIVNNGDGTLTFTFTYGEKVKTETITDADIINGTKAMTMKIKVYGNKPLTISNFTVVA